MKFVSHRRNTVAELQATPHQYGIEVDIRSHGDQLIIHHDPFVPGESFDNWIQAYQHDTLILNVKEEGLEQRLIDYMAKMGIDDYFFLDQSFPFLVKYSRLGERRCAVRLSEFEPVETALALSGQVNWVWVDCFTRFPLDHDKAKRLQDSGLKICLASPELHGHNAQEQIPVLASLLKEQNITPDAVCTKHLALWESLSCNR